jgi:3-keto-disaccharide hydrolase
MRIRSIVQVFILSIFGTLSAGNLYSDGWISLFNGKDLQGWHLRKPDGPNLWKVENGVYTTAAKGTDLQTDKDFYDFELHVEFKIAPGSNSGVYMRDRYEIQIFDNQGKPPNFSSCGALYRRTTPAANACKPVGEWEVFDIVFVGQRLTLRHNNQKILDNIDVGPKGTGASSERDDAPGPLRLQGDHGQVSFRNVKLRPLSKEEGAKLLLK